MAMPLFHEAQEGPRVVVHPSVAVELDWVLSTAHTLGRAGPPLLEDLYRRNPALAQEVLSLWGPDETLSYPGYLELSVLAQRANLLFGTDGDAVLAGLDQAARAGGPELPLLSETPEDRDRLHRRLDLLRRSAARRRRYIDVVSHVWSSVREEWAGEGLSAVRASIGEIRSQLDRGRPWQQFVKSECAPANDVIGRLGAQGEVAIVPAWFTHRGMVVDLPDLVVIGVRADSGATGSRARTEPLSRGLKVISDPTRLAILDALNQEEMTVTELASRFSLAQPTVSNHVKVLRDAGVLSERRESSRRLLTVDHSVVDQLVQGLQDLLGSGSPPS